MDRRSGSCKDKFRYRDIQRRAQGSYRDALIDSFDNENRTEFFFKRLSNHLCSPSRLMDIVEIDYHIEFIRSDTLFAINLFKKIIVVLYRPDPDG